MANPVPIALQGGVGGQVANRAGVTADAVTSYTQQKYPILSRYHGGQHPLAKEASLGKLEPLPETRAAFVKALTREMTANGEGSTLNPRTVKKYQDKMVLEGLGENVDLMYAREFQRWLRGVSVFNEPSLTPWGHRNMFHVPGVVEYLRELIQLRFDYQQSLMHLYMQPPQTLLDLELYYKYIVLQFGLVIPRNDGLALPQDDLPNGSDPRSFMSISGMLYFLDDYQLTSFRERDLPLTDKATIDAGDANADHVDERLRDERATLGDVAHARGMQTPAPNAQPATAPINAPAPVAPDAITALTLALERDRLQRETELAQLRADEAARARRHEDTVLQMRAQHQEQIANIEQQNQQQLAANRAEQARLIQQIKDSAGGISSTERAELTRQLTEQQAAAKAAADASKKAIQRLEREQRAAVKQLEDDARNERQRSEKETNKLSRTIAMLEAERLAANSREQAQRMRIEAAEQQVRAVRMVRTAEEEAEMARRVAQIQKQQTDAFTQALGSLGAAFTAKTQEATDQILQHIKSIGTYDTMSQAIDSLANIQGHYGQQSAVLMDAIRTILLESQQAAKDESTRRMEEAKRAAENEQLTKAERAQLQQAYNAAAVKDEMLGQALEELTRTITTMGVKTEAAITPEEAAANDVLRGAVKDAVHDVQSDAVRSGITGQIAQVPAEANNAVDTAIRRSLEGAKIPVEGLQNIEHMDWETRKNVMKVLHEHRQNIAPKLAHAYNLRMLEYGHRMIDSLFADLRNTDVDFAANGAYRNAARAVFYAVLHNPLFSATGSDTRLHEELLWTFQAVEQFLHSLYLPGQEETVHTPVQAIINRLYEGDDVDRKYAFKTLDRAFAVAQALGWSNEVIEDHASAMQQTASEVVLGRLYDLFEEHDVSRTLPTGMDVEGADYAERHHVAEALLLKPEKTANDDDKKYTLGMIKTRVKAEAERMLAEETQLVKHELANAHVLSNVNPDHGRAYVRAILNGVVNALAADDARPAEIIAIVGNMAQRQYAEHAAATRPIVEYILNNNTVASDAERNQMQEYAAAASAAHAVISMLATVYTSFGQHVAESNKTAAELQLPRKVIKGLDSAIKEANAGVEDTRIALAQARMALAKQAVQDSPPNPHHFDARRQMGAALLAIGNTTAPEVIDLVSVADFPPLVLGPRNEDPAASTNEILAAASQDVRDFAQTRAGEKTMKSTVHLIDSNHGVVGTAMKTILETMYNEAPVIPASALVEMKLALAQQAGAQMTAPESGHMEVEGAVDVGHLTNKTKALAIEIGELEKVQPRLTEEVHLTLKAAREKHPVESAQLERAMKALIAMQNDARSGTKTKSMILHWRSLLIEAQRLDSNPLKYEPAYSAPRNVHASRPI